MSQKHKHPLNWRFRRELGPDEKLLTPEEIALEDAPEPVAPDYMNDDWPRARPFQEDGHLADDAWRKEHPDAE